MPPRKPRCEFKECKLPAQRISGDCGFCQGHFCNNHRLLEDHKCRNLEDVSSSPDWWLVGLTGSLPYSEDILADCISLSSSARRKHTRPTRHSSSNVSEPRSSRASKRRARRLGVMPAGSLAADRSTTDAKVEKNRIQVRQTTGLGQRGEAMGRKSGKRRRAAAARMALLGSDMHAPSL